MAPKQAKDAQSKYDYSSMKAGMKVQVESEGEWHKAEILDVSESKKRAARPVKITYPEYDKSYDEWVGGDRLKIRGKALKKVAPESPERPERPPLEFNFGYWKIRGLGSIFRMIFEYRGAKYTDHQYESFDDWFKAAKPAILEKSPLANLPYVQCGNDTVCQTNACLNYIGGRLRLNGGGNRARLLNDQLLCEVMDIRNKFIQFCYPFAKVVRSEAEHKEAAVSCLESGPFAKFEAVLEKGDTDYFCGKGPCTSDFHIWEMLDQHRMLAEKHGVDDIFAKIPKCKAFFDRFRALPQLEKYFASDAYKLPVNNPIADPHFM